MREIFSVNGQFTAESKQDLINSMKTWDSLSAEKQGRIFEDVRNTALYGRASYAHQVADALHELHKDKAFEKVWGVIADLEGPLKNAECMQARERPMFSVGGKFTAESAKELLETVRDFRTFSPAKQKQVSDDIMQTAAYADLEYAQKMEESFKQLALRLPQKPKEIKGSEYPVTKAVNTLLTGVSKILEARYEDERKTNEAVHEMLRPLAALIQGKRLG